MKDEAPASPKDEALRLALEDLKSALCDQSGKCCINGSDADRLVVDRSLAVIKQVLAQPEQDGYCKHCTNGCFACDARKQPEPEPVATNDISKECVDETAKQRHEPEPDYYGLTADHLWISIPKDHYDRLKPEYRMACYTSPPKREWQGLADEEIDTWNIVGHESLREFVRAIEAKLKAKNGFPQTEKNT